MTVDLDQFREDYPQFIDSSVFSDTRIQRSLDRAALRMDESMNWGDLYDEGQGLLAAHLMTVSDLASSTSGSNAGSLKSISIDKEVAVTYSDSKSSSSAGVNASLSATRYGVEFQELMKLIAIPVRII